jgi:hypothetical protein
MSPCFPIISTKAKKSKLKILLQNQTKAKLVIIVSAIVNRHSQIPAVESRKSVVIVSARANRHLSVMGGRTTFDGARNKLYFISYV